MRIGVCGTGNMGSAITERLLEQGNQVSVWNRTWEKTKPLLELGAAFATSPKALVTGCEIVISMVIDDKAVLSVYQSDDGLLSTDLHNKLIIEMSTILPETSKYVDNKVRLKGGRYIECPVGGSVQPALNGQLLGLVGGDQDVVDEARSVLNQLCRRLDHVGNIGAGASMKLAVNLPLVVYWESVGEALAIAKHAGIDLSHAADILADTSGTIKVAPGRLPRIADIANGGTPEGVSFSIEGMAKDLKLMKAVANKYGISTPVTNAASSSYEQAISDGWAEYDGVLLAAWRVLESQNA